MQPALGDLQQKFVREMERLAKKEDGNRVKVPLIKVVPWGTLRTEEDFFCVPHAFEPEKRRYFSKADEVATGVPSPDVHDQLRPCRERL